MMDCKCGEWDKIGYCVKCGQHYTDQWEALRKEIESLEEWVYTSRRDKSHLEESCNAEKQRGDEWKRRLHEYKNMLDSLPGSVLSPGDGILPQPLESVSYHEAIRRKYPEINEWFKDE